MIESPGSPPRPPTAEVEISAPENGDDVPPCSTLNETLTFVIEQMPSLPLEAAEIIAEVTLSTIHKSNSIFKNKEAFLSFFKNVVESLAERVTKQLTQGFSSAFGTPEEMKKLLSQIHEFLQQFNPNS